MAVAVAVGAVVPSSEPELAKLTGLVCMLLLSADPFSGIVIDFATLASGSLIVEAKGASLALLMPGFAAPSKALTALNPGFGLS